VKGRPEAERNGASLLPGVTPAEGWSNRRPMLVVGGTAAVALSGFVCWAGRAGNGLLLVAFLSVVPVVVREVRWLFGAGDRLDAGQGRQGPP
jgi:hypothetical protein